MTHHLKPPAHWYYYNPETGMIRRFDIQPYEMPGFKRWNLGTPLVEIDGVTQFGRTEPLDIPLGRE